MLNEFPEITKNGIRRIAKLQEPSINYSADSFIIDGEKGVAEAIASGWQIRQIVVDKTKTLKFNQIHFSKFNTLVSDSASMSRMSKVNTSPGILAEVIIPTPRPIKLNENLIVCSSISDPGNLGTIIRTADWFGIQNLILSEDTVYPYSSKVVRSTMGSIYRVNIEIIDNLYSKLSELKKQGYSLIATSLNGEAQITAKPPFCLILGNESRGISKDIIGLATHNYTIPKYGHAESLNVSVACGIVLSNLKK